MNVLEINMDRLGKTTTTLAALVVLTPVVGMAQNIHMCVINRTQIDLPVRICSDYDGECWDQSVVRSGGRYRAYDMGLTRTTTRTGSLSIGNFSDQVASHILSMGGDTDDFAGDHRIVFNFAGAGSDERVESDMDYVCRLHRYTINQGENEFGPYAFVQGPYSGDHGGGGYHRGVGTITRQGIESVVADAPDAIDYSPSSDLLLLPGIVQDEWEEQVLGRLHRASPGSGYALTRAVWVGVLEQGDEKSHYITLSTSENYVFTAFCDADCDDLDLEIFKGGDSIDDDFYPDDYPVVRLASPTSGRYRIEVSMPHCSTETCYYSLGVWSR